LLHATHQRVVAALRALGSLLPQKPDSRRDASRLVHPWRTDSNRTYPSVGLTPSRLLAFLQAADAGSPQVQFELFAEMLQKWPRLAAVENTRRLALTGLDWEVIPAAQGADGPGRADAVRAADFCRDVLARVERLRDTLDYLANAIGYGLAVAELVWEDGQLVDLVPVPYSRLLSDPHEPWRLRVLTEDEPGLGVALDEYPFKWLVHRPRATPGRSFDGGILRASVLLYLAQNLSFKDWLIYSQIAGMPVRVAQFEPGTPEGDRQQLLKMLETLGTDAVAVFGKNVDLKFIEASHAGERPYQPLQEYCNTEITILWLGQHLTTDLKNSGSRAAAEIHDRVREDLLVDDIADEGQTIRRDLLTPLVQARFGDGVPIPCFRRSLIQAVDTRVLVDTLAVAVNQLGLEVPRRWVHQALGIPEPQADEPVLSARRPA
jgi:phage gp29-like protein